MPIRDSLARWLAPSVKASVVGLAPGELPDRALEKTFDDATLLSTYADDSWPYICSRILAENGSMPPLRVGVIDKAGTFNAVRPDHPVQALLDNPSPMVTGVDFRELLITYLELVGHAPIEFVRPSPGARIGTGKRGNAGFEMYIHNPSPWRIVGNADGTIRGYLWINTSESDIRWTTDQMTYLRWINPNSRWYGQGRIQAVRQAIMAEEYAAIRDKKFEKNMGVPPGILSSEMPLGDPQAQILQRRWEQAVGGYANSGKIAILGSKTSYQPIVANARDAQWVEQRRWRIQEFGAAFGIPVVILVGMKDATFANAAEAVDYLWEFTLQPRLDKIAAMFTQRVLPLITNEALVARFDYSNVDALNDNEAEIVNRASAMSTTGVVTIDEIRLVMGLPAFGSPVGDRIMMPGSLASFSSKELLAPPPANADARQVTEPKPAPTSPKPPSKAAPEPVVRAVDKDALLAPIADGYRRDLGSFFAAQASALKPLTSGKTSPEETAILAERAIAIITAKRWYERLLRISEGVVASSLTVGAANAAETLGEAVTFTATSPEATVLLGRHLERLGVGIQNTTVSDVSRVLAEALEKDFTLAEIREGLGELFDDYADWRLDRIARTETSAAYNLGSLGQYREAGVILVTVVDGDGDAVCADWNGRTGVPLEEAENAPLGHPNCTRTFIPETDGLGREIAPDIILSDQPEHTTDIGDAMVGLRKDMADLSAEVRKPLVLSPISDAMLGLRQDMADLAAEVRKPRKRSLVRDEVGRVIGSEET